MSDNLSRLPRELHSRTGTGIQVSLWWSPANDKTWVVVRDDGTETGFVVPVHAGERARDVFEHPYAYAARRGVPTTGSAA